MKSPPVQVPGLGRARRHRALHRGVRRRAEAAGRRGAHQGRADRLAAYHGLVGSPGCRARAQPGWPCARCHLRILRLVATDRAAHRPGHAVSVGAAPRGQPLRGAALRRALRARPQRGRGRAVGLTRAGARGARAGSRRSSTTRTRCSPSPAAPRSWPSARACRSGAAARWRCRSTCRARSRTCSSTPSSTSCTCTSRSLRARRRPRCATRAR